MSGREIRKLALRKIIDGSDMAIISTLYFFTAILFVTLTEMLIYILLKMTGFDDYHPLDPHYYMESKLALVMLILRYFLYLSMFSALMFLVCRSYITFTADNPEHSSGGVNKFLSGHIRRLLVPSLRSNACLMLIKVLVALPLTVSIYGIVHYFQLGARGGVGIFGLFCFMISIGFTLVWTGMILRYYLSLFLVPYIIDLNPRANLFDACDLSIRLMEGNHMRTVGFMISLLPVLLPCLLVYPSVIIYPYLTECRLLLAKDIMGDYWQDKIPAMARRWEKQERRKD